MLLSVTMEGFKWSDPIVIMSPTFLDPPPKKFLIQDSSGLSLKLRIENRPDQTGRRYVTVFCSCWIINQTGLPLAFAKAKGGGSTLAASSPSPGRAAPRMIGWSDVCVKIADDSPRAALPAHLAVIAERNAAGAGRIRESEWSKKFNVTTIGVTGVISVVDLSTTGSSSSGGGGRRSSISRSSSQSFGSSQDMADEISRRSSVDESLDSPRRLAALRGRHDISVTIKLGKGKYKRTKIVRLVPQWTLRNTLDRPVQMKQADASEYTPVVTVPPRTSLPIFWTDHSR